MKHLMCAAVLAAAVAQPCLAQAVTQWKLATGYRAESFHTQNIARFAEEVEAATRGRLKIEVAPNNSLVKLAEIPKAVAEGKVQAGEAIMSGMGKEVPLAGADGVPFVVASYDAVRKMWGLQRPGIEREFDRLGLKVLYAVPWPPQGIYTNKPINSVADMKGLKMRAYNPNTAKIAELVGAQPVTVQAAELAQAMTTGAVNANMTSGATGVDTKAWEHVKYYYDTQAWIPKNVVFVSQKAFDALDKASQDAVLKAAAAAEERGWKESEVTAKSTVETLQKNGMTVGPPSAQLKADLKKIGDTITADWIKAAGDDGKAIVDAYRK
jgi:TRAP-type C4-dicarboxylate transport system substrate-binding protein